MKTHYNKLPPDFSNWHAFRGYMEKKHPSALKKETFEIVVSAMELRSQVQINTLYRFDSDFVKARLFEEYDQCGELTFDELRALQCAYITQFGVMDPDHLLLVKLRSLERLLYTKKYN